MIEVCDIRQPESIAPVLLHPVVTPSRPKALDLFCGAGGAGMGLHRAGFDVTGVDIKHQRRYPFTFLLGVITVASMNDPSSGTAARP